MKPILEKLPLPWILGSAGALLAGLLAGPAALYWIGGWLAGAYADPGGLPALWVRIYSDAIRFRGAGLVFLLGPLLMFQIVWLALAALGKLRRWQ